VEDIQHVSWVFAEFNSLPNLVNESQIMATKIRIDDDVLAVLNRSTITETALTLPDQLDRKLYEKVNKVIAAAGGKWNKKTKSHLFPSDPREVLGLAITTKSVDNKKQIFQEFFTPPDVAAQVCRFVYPGAKVLEPSAGVGNIAKAASDAGGLVKCYELQEQHVKKLQELGLDAEQADFLKVAVSAEFRLVLMNPPFATGQFQAHVQHAFKFLLPGGALTAVGPKNLGGNRTKSQQAFHNWLSNTEHTVTDLPSGTFKSAGTSIDVVLLTIRNRGSRHAK